MYKSVIKRLADIIVSIIALIIISPIILTLILILFYVNDGKPFFLQERPGKNQIIFKIIKFKTMNDRKDQHGNLLPDYHRITSVGKIIRNLSLDELLQLINVIKGDMSIVGPRPLLIEYLPLYNEEQAKRHNVKPGITGWAQVNGRNGISWDQKFKLDIWYVHNISFITDIKIIFKTIVKIIAREGIYASETETMEYFRGSNSKIT